MRGHCLLVMLLVALAGAVPASARQPKAFEAHRATVGRVEPGTGEAVQLEALLRAGVNTVLVPSDAAADATAPLAARVQALGLTLLVGGRSDSSDAWTVRLPEEEPFSISTTRIASWPESLEALAQLYADRARSADRPGSAPLALAGGAPEDEAWYLLPGPIEVTGPPRAGAAAAAAAFRERHPSVAAGIHETLQADPLVFHRVVGLPGRSEDRVLVAMGAKGRFRVNVAALFENDTVLRDAVTGRITLVSFGQVTVTPDASGLVLLEVAR